MTAKSTKKTARQPIVKDTEKPGADAKKTEEITAARNEAEAKLLETQEKYLRLTAEYDNYRKRTLREKMELVTFAGEETILQLLPVMDDFERALSSLSSANDIEAVKKGIELIYNKFRDFLSGKGVKAMDCLHREFDTDLHEAVTKIPVDEKKLKGKIVDVIEKGYLLHDKVIRHSKVVIGD